MNLSVELHITNTMSSLKTRCYTPPDAQSMLGEMMEDKRDWSAVWLGVGYSL